jgi:DNA-binding GntR family transcriptional regulator
VDEQAITAEYGISRTPLREALKVLASEGLVTLTPGRGCTVTLLTEQDLDEIFPILALLEGRCAYEATLRMNAAAKARIEALHTELEGHFAANSIEAFFDANQRFHLTVQEIAGNRWLTQLVQETRQKLKLMRFHSLFQEGRLQESLEEHRAIVEALCRADAPAAQAAMENHLLQGRRAMGRLADA